MKKAKQIAGQWKEEINVMYTRLNVMYTRLNNTITNAIKNVVER